MRLHRFTRPVLASALVLTLSACRNTAALDPIVGTFLATTFTVTPAGEATLNALALGSTLGINVANNLVTAGTLVMPPNVTGGPTIVASMAGTAVVTGSTVRFAQTADTFVRDLTFTLVGNQLQALNQVVAGTQYTLVLTRQ